MPSRHKSFCWDKSLAVIIPKDNNLKALSQNSFKTSQNTQDINLTSHSYLPEYLKEITDSHHHYVFPHTRSLYKSQLKEFLDLKIPLASPCFTNNTNVSLLQFSRDEHSDYCKKAFHSYFHYKKKGREAYFNNSKSIKYFKSKKSGKIGFYKENLQQEYKDKAIEATMLWNQIEQEAKLSGLIPVFFTATLKGHLHPFPKGGNISKVGFDYERDFKAGIADLQSLHRDIMVQSNRTLSYNIKFFRALEYHKSYVGHSHAVYFVKPQDSGSFEAILKNKISLNQNIGKHDIKVIDEYEENFSIPYLLKYMKKSAFNMTLDELEVFDGWRRALGIRNLYSQSRLTVPKWVIRKTKYYFGKTTLSGKINKDYWKLSHKSLYECIRANVSINSKVYDTENNLLREYNVDPLEQEKYRVARTREEICHYETFNKEEFLKRKTYKTKSLTVKKILKNKELLVYDKGWYEMLEIEVGACSRVGHGVLAKLMKLEAKSKQLKLITSSFKKWFNENETLFYIENFLKEEELILNTKL